MNHHRHTHSNTLIGLILIVLGILFLISRFTDYDLGDFISTWWPMILIIIGLKKMTTPGAPRFGGGFLIFVIGVIFQLIELDVLRWSYLSYLWPLILIGVGLRLILFPRQADSQQKTSVDRNTIDNVAIFGGTDLVVTSQEFQGGQATALFGAVEIDLRGANLKEGTATINANALFGAVEVKVPEGWSVDIEGTPVFGAMENKCKAPEKPDAPNLRIKGSAIFGGIEVKQ